MSKEHDEWVKRHLGVDPSAYASTDPDPDITSSANGDLNTSADPNAGPNMSVDPNAGPNQSVDPNAGQPTLSVDPNAGPNISVDPSSPKSPLHDIWKAGYDAAFAAPDDLHDAPSPYSEEARAAYVAGVAAGVAAARQQGPATPLAPTNAPSEQIPASFELGGAPAFRYSLPNVPIAHASIPTPAALIEVDFLLRGSVTLSFPEAPQGISTDVNDQGWRVEATKALGPITTGLRVSGIGTGSPSIGVTMGARYSNAEVRLNSDGSVSFIGQVTFDYDVPSQGFGKVAVKGQAGFEVRVTVIPQVPPPQPIETTESWFEANADALAAAAIITLIVVVAIAAAPETGGGSLVLLKVAEQVAEQAPAFAR